MTNAGGAVTSDQFHPLSHPAAAPGRWPPQRQDPPMPPTPSPSPAPAQDVYRRILGEDVTQIGYYTERVQRMVGKVQLQRHHPLRASRRRSLLEEKR